MRELIRLTETGNVCVRPERASALTVARGIPARTSLEGVILARLTMATRSRSLRRRVRFLSAVLAGLFLSALPSPPAQSAIQCESHIGFDGHYKVGHWAPATLRLTNDGEDFDGEVEIVVPDGEKLNHVYSRPISLPGPRSTKDVRFLLHFRSRNVGQVTVRLRKGRNVAVLGQPGVIGHPPSHRLFAICDEVGGLAPLSMLGGVETDKDEVRYIFMRMPPQFLPDNVSAYAGLHGVCLGDLDPSSVPLGAQDAMRDYLFSGGNLMVFTGDSGQRYRDTWVEDLLPVEIADSRTVDSLPELEQVYGGGLRVDSGLVITNAHLRADDHRLLSVYPPSGPPLIAIGALGRGKSAFLAFDPDDRAFTTYRGSKAMMTALVDNCQPIPRLMDPNRGNPSLGFGFVDSWSERDLELDNQLRAHPSMRIPNFTFIGAFLILYVIILGPVNYLILKRKKRLELAWLTVPAIVLVFSAGAYSVGRLTKGSETVVHAASLLRGSAGAPGLSFETYFGLFSPGKASYNIDVQGGGAPLRPYREGAESGGMRLVFNDGIAMPDYGMNMWTMDTFTTVGYWLPEDAPGVIEGRLVLRDGALHGRIRNNLGLTIEGGALVIGNNVIPDLGRIASGEDCEVRDRALRVDNRAFQGVLEPALGREHERRLAQKLLSFVDKCQPIRYGEGGSATLWGWVDPRRTPVPAVGVKTSARREGAALLSLEIPVDWESGTIPTGFCRRSFSYRTGGTLDGENGLMIAAGTVVVDFLPPAALRPQDVHALNVYLDIVAPSGLNYAVSIYNWSQGRWQPLPVNTGSVNRGFPMGAQPEIYFQRTNGLVRVRIEQKEVRQAGMFGGGFGGGFGGFPSQTVGGNDAIVIKQVDLVIEPRVQAEQSG